MAILLFADHDNVTLSDATARALSAASAMGGDVDILIAGSGGAGGAVASDAASFRACAAFCSPRPMRWRSALQNRPRR